MLFFFFPSIKLMSPPSKDSDSHSDDTRSDERVKDEGEDGGLNDGVQETSRRESGPEAWKFDDVRIEVRREEVKSPVRLMVASKTLVIRALVVFYLW
jgi:hypothetical protein